MNLRWRHCAVFGWWTALLFTLGAHASEAVWALKATGTTGWPVADGDGGSARVAVEPALKWKLPTVDLRARLRVRWMDLQGDQRTDADLREMTAAWRASELSITVGAQQLNWGRMDILRVTDVVNPVDQHDLFFEELPEAKLALWMANLEWQSGSQSLQLVASPQVPLDRLPARWTGLPVRVTKPKSSLDNSTLAARYGFEWLGWNADLMAVRGWQTAATLRPVAAATGLRLQTAVSRQNSVGFSADKPFGPSVLRLEALYARRSPQDEAAAQGLSKQRHASLGSGLDVRAGPWWFAAQVVAEHSSKPSNGAYKPVFVSAIVQRKWLQDRLSARGLHVRETGSGSSSWTSFQATYELSPNQLLQLQGDWFRGHSNGAFADLKARSRIAASARLQF